IFLKQSYGLGSPEIFAVYIASQATSIAVYPRVGRWVSSRGDRSTQLYASLGRSMLFPSFLLVGMAALPYVARLGIAIALHPGVRRGAVLVEGPHPRRIRCDGPIHGSGSSREPRRRASRDCRTECREGGVVRGRAARRPCDGGPRRRPGFGRPGARNEAMGLCD